MTGVQYCEDSPVKLPSVALAVLCSHTLPLTVGVLLAGPPLARCMQMQYVLEFAKIEAYQVLLTILVCSLTLLNYLMTSVLLILLQECE